MRRLSLLVLILSAFAVRLYALDAKGLAYDEAATALMARAAPLEIIDFHWRAAFEHPPFWQLFMHFWSLGFGQSEFALRLPSVLAGVLTISLLWQLARQVNLSAATALTGAFLATVAPVLVYYSQEARMYALVVALALASLIVTQRLAHRPTWRKIGLYLLINWAMLGLHYYSALLIAAEGLFLLVWLLAHRQPIRMWLWHGLALGLTALPLLAWMGFSPGFRDTADSVTVSVGAAPLSVLQFLDPLWRDLTFAAIRWGADQAVWGYVLLPLALLGVLRFCLPSQRTDRDMRSGDGLARWLLVCACLVPIGVTLLVSRTLATRYLLYIMPPLLLIMAAGITWLGRVHWLAGVAVFLVALAPTALALPHYFGPYQKSAYRAMTQYLLAQWQPQDALLIEGPRQHLLTKYYLPTDMPVLTAPIVELPAYWPINALPVVPEEMDDYLLQSLREYPNLWVSLTAENEVDPGEFVPKYLTAVAFQRDCQAWLDVRLCHFVSPHFVQPQVQTSLAALFGETLLLQEATVALADAHGAEPAALLVTLNWLAQTKPTVDYRVTLRLVDSAGTVLSQHDGFPIGPLLPPSTWNAGDAKPGYMAVPLAPTLPPGRYALVVNLYDPATLAPVPHHTPDQSTSDSARRVAIVTIDDTIEVSGN